jgi:hypothetical protein
VAVQEQHNQHNGRDHNHGPECDSFGVAGHDRNYSPNFSGVTEPACRVRVGLVHNTVNRRAGVIDLLKREELATLFTDFLAR